MTENEESTRDDVATRIQAHEESMKQRLDAHTARSEERFAAAVGKTSDAIGRAATFTKDHTPDAVGRRVEDIASRAQTALAADEPERP
ncbi:hypothetical protein [Microbacterium sp. 18062]|uniref:hypothetical protein n=1 Tax=Microbacterium sp. 18062 TaxID=2681410 RepID=UPI00135AD744|nr:hypothetical protein [Microbacterium sp. 18062]